MMLIDSALDHDRLLIGQPGALSQIATPALILDVDRLDANLDAMAGFARARGMALRPHGKTHKSIAVAKRQIAKGATGLCAARLGEAEVFAQGGIEDILITAPIVDPGALARLAALNVKIPRLKAVIDSEVQARALNEAMANLDAKKLDVLIDLDIGLHRTGIAPDQRADALAAVIASLAHLNLVGLQAYGGHLQHLPEGQARRDASRAALAPLVPLIARLKAQGHAIAIISGGGTGTYEGDSDPTTRVLNEIQPGSYAVMDREYLEIEAAGDASWRFEPALHVLTRVISTNADGFVTLDAGLKAFATDGPKPKPDWGAPIGSRYAFMGDEQGALILPDGAAKPTLGAMVALLVPHCDPTINLYDHYHVVRGDTLIDLWPIDARGKGR